MFPRLLNLPEDQSFFLFGARGTGKSTLLESRFNSEFSLWIDLLLPSEEERFARNPEELKALVLALPSSIKYIVIDEVQKLPKLLDVVHYLIEHTDKYFIMTGSSARKLKQGGANLLAGRAFVYHLFPLSYLELGNAFQQEQALCYGLLPKIEFFKDNEEKIRFLQAYTQTYLKEEIWNEHFIKKLDPFRRFLEVSAQCNGKIINFSNISRDVGVDDKTIKEYFSILEDTLIGFFLEPFQHSFRKRLSQKPKFYYFDTGVTRALSRQLSLTLLPGTSAYGEVFEHFIILDGEIVFAHDGSPNEPIIVIDLDDGRLSTFVGDNHVQAQKLLKVNFVKTSPSTETSKITELATGVAAGCAGLFAAGLAAYGYFRSDARVKLNRAIEDFGGESQQQSDTRKHVLHPIVTAVYERIKVSGFLGYLDATTAEQFVNAIQAVVDELQKQNVDLDLQKMSPEQQNRLLKEIVKQIRLQAIPQTVWCSRFFKAEVSPIQIEDKASAIASAVNLELNTSTSIAFKTPGFKL